MALTGTKVRKTIVSDVEMAVSASETVVSDVERIVSDPEMVVSDAGTAVSDAETAEPKQSFRPQIRRQHDRFGLRR